MTQALLDLVTTNSKYFFLFDTQPEAGSCLKKELDGSAIPPGNCLATEVGATNAPAD
jgi:hypothetical protein